MSESIFNKCQHNVSNRMWVPMRTLKVSRSGYGDAIKTVLEQCTRCGEQREQKVSFVDTMIHREPYIKSRGPLFKHAVNISHTHEIKEYNKIFK